MWTTHNDFIGQVGEAIVRGATPPDPTLYRLILCNPISALTRISTVADIIGSELLQENGYSPIAYAPAQGAYDSTQKRYEFPDTDCIFGASGGALQFSYAVLWQGRGNLANKPVSAVDSANDKLTVTAHGGVNGDRVIITSSIANPAGIDPNTVYYLKSLGADEVSLYSDIGLSSLVNITDLGSGDITLRWANGYPALLQGGDTVNIGDGNFHTVTVGWSWLNTGNVNGV
jgi:hypothetical protein